MKATSINRDAGEREKKREMLMSESRNVLFDHIYKQNVEHTCCSLAKTRKSKMLTDEIVKNLMYFLFLKSAALHLDSQGSPPHS